MPTVSFDGDVRWHVGAVVALAVLSGCAGSLYETPTATVTPVEVPTDEPQRPSSLAGLDGRELTSVGAFAEGHAEALDGQSYVWEVRKCRQYVRNGTVVGEECGGDAVTYVDETTYRWNHTAGPNSDDAPQFEPSVSRKSYANGTALYRQFDSADRIWYERTRATGDRTSFSFSGEQFVQLYLAVNESSVRRVQRDGRTLFRIDGQHHRVPTYSGAEVYQVVAHVDPTGVVTELRANYSQTYGDLTMRTSVRSTYSDVGQATVEPPEWIEAARANSSDDG